MSAVTTRFFERVRLSKPDYLPYGLIGAWVFSMIMLPIARWLYGDVAIPWGVTLSVLLQVTAVLLILRPVWGVRRLAMTVITVCVAAWTVEFVGSHTGFPFGVYSYTDVLQPQLGDVPLILPLAWLMMLPSAWAVAACVTRGKRGLPFIVVSAVAFTAWDLFLDPQMVAWNLWTWAEPGGYFGIPWVNYAGWLLSSALITALARPWRLPVFPLLLIYGVTWALETIGMAFFWGLPGPAIVGFFGMGAMLLLGWRRWRGDTETV
jgi:putative membrane protein